jgi:hypothetical protein
MEPVVGFLMAAVIVAAALLFGSQLLCWTRLAPREAWPHVLAGFGIGVVTLAYGILLLGLFSALKLLWVALLLLLMVACGVRQWRLVLRASESARRYLSKCWSGTGGRILLVFFGIWLLATLGNALLPPDGGDWDGLSQHLAQAWTYAQEGRVRPLWYDHHSQFPSTMQMLFAAGELADGYFTSRIIEWLMGVFSVVWAVLIAHRFLDTSKDRSAALWTAFIVITTPIFTWLTGVSYVDLGLSFFLLGGLYFFLDWVLNRQSGTALAAALMFGGALTVKTQALAVAGVILFAAVLLTIREQRSIRQLAVAALLTLIVGGPWYLKSYLLTGNPVYPFAYEVFGGKLWSYEQAHMYEVHQMAFGYGAMPPEIEMRYLPAWCERFVGPREPYKWLIGPVLLTIRPWDFAVDRSRVQQALLIHWIGPLYLPLILLLLCRHRPRAVAVTLWLFLPLWLWWFYSMQYARYLLPSLLLLAPLVGYSLSRLFVRRGVVATATGTLVVLWALFALLPLYLSFAMAWPAISGQITWDQYLSRVLDVYEPSQYISAHLAEDAVIATYGEPRGYYFQRAVIWADPGHSLLFPYAPMQDAEDLIATYRDLGITHVLINRLHVGDPAERKSWPLELVQEGIESGLLRPVGSFTRHPRYVHQYLLLRVADPAAPEPAS